MAYKLRDHVCIYKWILHVFMLLSFSIIAPLLENISSVQLLSRVQLFATPWTTACQASLSITNSWSAPKPMSIELVMPSNHLILCHPLLFLPSIKRPQHQGLFKWVSSSHQMAKVLKFQLQHQSFQWIFRRLISIRIDWLDLLAVQGILKSLLQHHSSKAPILWRSAFSQSNFHSHSWPLEKP